MGAAVSLYAASSSSKFAPSASRIFASVSEFRARAPRRQLEGERPARAGRPVLHEEPGEQPADRLSTLGEQLAPPSHAAP